VPRTRPPYPEEFKREAIELVRLTGKSVRQVATDLGVSEASLRGWIKQAERDEGKRPDGLSSDEREELRRLRREKRTLRMEREILKKAAPFSTPHPTEVATLRALYVTDQRSASRFCK
jgi:transposase